MIYHFRGNWEFDQLRIGLHWYSCFNTSNMLLSENLNQFWIFGPFFCVGIGRPPGQMDPKAFQVQRFNKLAHERVNVNHFLFHFVLSVDFYSNMFFNEPDWCCIARRGKQSEEKGLTECARSANTDQKYKHLRQALKLYRPGKILGSWNICRPFCRQNTDLKEDATISIMLIYHTDEVELEIGVRNICVFCCIIKTHVHSEAKLEIYI